MNEYGSLVKRLRRRPLTAETAVRFRYELSRETPMNTEFVGVCYTPKKWSKSGPEGMFTGFLEKVPSNPHIYWVFWTFAGSAEKIRYQVA